MIKFFRKIRYNLMSENKTSKYLKYAIGEIILVMVGILLALQVNNWNENRLEKNEVSNYIQQIKTELESDIIHFFNDISKMQNWLNYLNKVSDGKYNEVDLSQLYNSLPRNLSSRNFGTSYNKMLESGIIKHITTNQLVEKLQIYYLTNCSEYNSKTEFHANFVSDHIEGPLLLMLNQKKGFLVDPKEVLEELENGKIKSLINWQISYFEYQIPSIKQNIIQAEDLIRLIDEI
jgi:hypothetical protein